MKILGPVVNNEDAMPLSEVLTTPRYVDHGSNASVARPSGSRPVIWRGTVEPLNMLNGDEWENESSNVVVGNGITDARRLTQVQFDAIATKDPTTLYIIVG